MLTSENKEFCSETESCFELLKAYHTTNYSSKLSRNTQLLSPQNFSQALCWCRTSPRWRSPICCHPASTPSSATWSPACATPTPRRGSAPTRSWSTRGSPSSASPSSASWSPASSPQGNSGGGGRLNLNGLFKVSGCFLIL